MKKKQALIEQQYALETASANARAERQKIKTQADLELLRKDQDAAEAEAEVNVLRSFDGDEHCHPYRKVTLIQGIRIT